MTPKEKFYSLVEVAVKTAIGFLPGYISGAFNAIVDGVKSNVLSKRAESWKEEIVKRVERLETAFDDLVSSESFANSLLRATELAIKTESDEKRKLLANALVNSYSNNIEEDKIIIFFDLIEKYTSLHIQVIRYVHDGYLKETFFNDIRPSYLALFRLKFSSVDGEYLEKVVSDLKNDYVLASFKNDVVVPPVRYRTQLLTKLGIDFYDFLKPETDGDSGQD